MEFKEIFEIPEKEARKKVRNHTKESLRWRLQEIRRQLRRQSTALRIIRETVRGLEAVIDRME